MAGGGDVDEEVTDGGLIEVGGSIGCPALFTTQRVPPAATLSFGPLRAKTSLD